MSVRNKAGLFDVSHMGEIVVEGEKAVSFLESLTCNRIDDLENGQVHYNALINPQGGLVDDLTVYRQSKNSFFIVANASNVESVYNYFLQNKIADVDIRNRSDEYHQIAIQGPLAAAIFCEVTGFNDSGLTYYRFRDEQILGAPMRISRTGYTGEDGFEIYSSPEAGVALWETLLEKGKDAGLVPVGLGARDSLRLEARYPLYGHELGPDISPVESGISFIVKEKSTPYAGYDRIMADKKNGPSRKMTGFLLEGPGLPREHYPILDSTGAQIGETASGGYSPVLKKGMGTALLPAEHSVPGAVLQMQIRTKTVPIRLHKGPFVRGTAGKVR